jgi:uncharacterized protein YceK
VNKINIRIEVTDSGVKRTIIMKTICMFLAMAGVLVLGGCGSESTSNEAEVEAQGKVNTQSISTDNVFSGQVRALEKAKKVEQLILDTANQHRMSIDKMTE